MSPAAHRRFRLYPAEQHWWSFADYGAVLDVMARLRPARVLEFGPGSSTLALIEGGAQRIDCCEDDKRWATVHRSRLEHRFSGKVAIVDYQWSDPVSIPALDPERYDLALIDGPRETPKRIAVLDYCLQRCAWVLIPTESASGSRLLREACEERAGRNFRTLTITETGPLAGAFALFSPPC